MENTIDFDVAIVGYGPVGQALAIMLGQKGYRVGVFERWLGLYPLPRACVVDHEVMRIIQSLDVADEFAELAVPTNGEYLWLNAAGETLYHFKYPRDGISGWPARNLIYQPDLESLLHRRTQLLDTVELNQGWEAVGYSEGKDYATLTVQAGTPCVTGNQTSAGQQRVVTARYVVGADGANSFVRRATGMGWTDLGFRADWLVIDYKPNDPTKELDMPEAGQICDPARPITLMRHMGRKHVRWEVMLLPGETAADLTQPAMVWSLIDRWVKPSDGEITRAAVYTFQSGVAASWVKGRSILVGDAAHLMPPFLGQGLCSGLRDARSAFWRLDLILGGLAEPDLLESYQKERNEHVTCVIARAVALGKVLCITDPQEAAKRDAAILGGTAPAIPPFPGLANGLLHRSVSGAVAEPVGQLSLQAQIKLDGQVGRLDDLTGSSWVVLALGSADEFTLDDSQKAFAKQLGMRIVRLDDEDTDFHGKYHAYMNALGVEALIVRPDFYVFGASHTVQDVPGMLDELKRQLPLTGQPNKTKATANSN